MLLPVVVVGGWQGKMAVERRTNLFSSCRGGGLDDGIDDGDLPKGFRYTRVLTHVITIHVPERNHSHRAKVKRRARENDTHTPTQTRTERLEKGGILCRVFVLLGLKLRRVFSLSRRPITLAKTHKRKKTIVFSHARTQKAEARTGAEMRSRTSTKPN